MQEKQVNTWQCGYGESRTKWAPARLTNVKTAFVNLLCYLNRPYPSTTHRSDDLFINTAIIIMQLATYQMDITIKLPSFGQKVGQCSKCDATLALVRQNGVTKS